MAGHHVTHKETAMANSRMVEMDNDKVSLETLMATLETRKGKLHKAEHQPKARDRKHKPIKNMVIEQMQTAISQSRISICQKPPVINLCRRLDYLRHLNQAVTMVALVINPAIGLLANLLTDLIIARDKPYAAKEEPHTLV